jgi:ribonuclease HIII
VSHTRDRQQEGNLLPLWADLRYEFTSGEKGSMKYDDEVPEKKLAIYTSPLTADQASRLAAIMREEGWKIDPRPYTICYGQKEGLTLAIYEKGPKVVIQGKGTQDFVQFRLEPEILGEARLGYEETLHPDRYEPHFGIDESGKGDFFGPLVVAGVYVDADIARAMVHAGVQDSKRITTDARIRELAAAILEIRGVRSSVIMIGPEKYNELYEKIGNVNRLLAWGHARIIENLAEQRPDCPRALCDQFASPSLTERALMKRGREIQIDQRTKAESDPAVAAASILAREKLVEWFRTSGKSFGLVFPKGASAAVKAVATQLVSERGGEVLRQVAKVHFRTAHEVAPDAYAAPAPRTEWVRRGAKSE